MAEQLEAMKLPPVTSDKDEARKHLIECGVCRIAGALSASQLAALRRETEVAESMDSRTDQSYSYSHGANRRIWSLFNRAQCFLDLAENPTALQVVRTILGKDALVSNVSANITGPGGVAMAPHWDQDWAERPWPNAFVAHVIWMIDDFTVENGATLVSPGSHLLDSQPNEASMVPATGSAGTALVIDGRTWHGTGPNTTTDMRRTGILIYYCRPYIRQQENMSLSLANAIRDSMPPYRRKLYGLEFWEYLNMVGGPPADLPRF
ncbi:MAG TPA: phytanoyl-CoA dioxygenase family protein [Streptosporangiaceae bacterium]|nr:phytanoyl-CoA dioxygenase family protein [Streptosporangiaceae bacterium]